MGGQVDFAGGRYCFVMELGLIKVIVLLKQSGLKRGLLPTDINNHSACCEDLSQGARELSPFPARLVRTLPDSRETLLNLSTTDAVVSRKNSPAHNLVAAIACQIGQFRFGLTRQLAEEYVSQIARFAAINVALKRLNP